MSYGQNVINMSDNSVAHFKCTYAGLFSTTISIRLPGGHGLIAKSSWRRKTTVKHKLAQIFKANGYELIDIKEMSERVFGSNESGSNENITDKEDDVFFYLSLPYKYQSSLDFGSDIGDQSFSYRAEYERIRTRILSKKGAKGANQFNDLFVVRTDKSKLSQSEVTAYDMGLILGSRKKTIFSNNFSSRVYNIVLPPIEGNFEFQENATLVPIVTLTLRPNSKEFRKTISLSVIQVPSIKKGGEARRELDSNGIRSQYFKDFHFDDKYEFLDLRLKQEWSIDQIVREFLNALIELFSRSEYKVRNWNSISELVAIENQTTVIADCLLKKEINDYHTGRLTQIGEAKLQKIIRDVFATGEDDLHLALKIEKMDITEETKIDARNLSLYYHRDNRTINVSSNSSEDFPRSSIKWLFAQTFYQVLGISVVRAMVKSFYREIENAGGSRSMVDIENSLIRDMEEFYDLDIISNAYKLKYNRLKTISGIEKEYLELKDKLTSLKTNQNLLQQQRESILLVILTAEVILVTFFQTAKGFIYLQYAIGALMVGVPLGMLLWYWRLTSHQFLGRDQS
jgi:hypothetical protein